MKVLVIAVILGPLLVWLTIRFVTGGDGSERTARKAQASDFAARLKALPPAVSGQTADLVLESRPAQKIAVIAAVRGLTGMGLVEARNAVEVTPSVSGTATHAVARLERAGAAVVTEPSPG